MQNENEKAAAVEPMVVTDDSTITETELRVIAKMRGDGEYASSLAWKAANEISALRQERDIERRALELACNKLFSEGIIIEENTDEPAIAPHPDHFRKRAKLTV